MTYLLLVILLPATMLLPNSQEIMGISQTQASGSCMAIINIRWNPTLRWSFIIGAVIAVGILSMSGISEFLYFQF